MNADGEWLIYAPSNGLCFTISLSTSLKEIVLSMSGFNEWKNHTKHVNEQ